MRFSRCLSYLSTTLAVHSDSIGSFWNPLFATRKVWVYNLQSDTIFECTTYLRPPDLCRGVPNALGILYLPLILFYFNLIVNCCYY